MRKITLFILLSCIFISCSTIPKYLVFSEVGDLSEHYQDGVFITTGEISDSYIPVSVLKIEGFDGYIPKDEREIASEKLLPDDLYGERSLSLKKIKPRNGLYYYGSYKNYKHKFFELNDAFKELAKKAKECNANAVINVRIEDISYYDKSGFFSIGYKVYGLAVSIK